MPSFDNIFAALTLNFNLMILATYFLSFYFLSQLKYQLKQFGSGRLSDDPNDQVYFIRSMFYFYSVKL